MPSPFPGMDPYLEDAVLWRGFHTRFIADMQVILNRVLRPRYFAVLEERIYLDDSGEDGIEQLRFPDVNVVRPLNERSKSRRNGSAAVLEIDPFVEVFDEDLAIKERRLEIRSAGRRELVCVIEMLSPTNKRPGSDGQKSFLAKREEVMQSNAHWMEIDLLRSGARHCPGGRLPRSDYQVRLSRASSRPSWQVWPFSVRDRMPRVAVPLHRKDADVPLNLTETMDTAYDNGAFSQIIDYRSRPADPLAAADATWSTKLLKKSGCR